MVSKTRVFAFIILILCMAYISSIAGLEIKIVPLKSIYLLREPILVHYEIRNTGPYSVALQQNEIANGFKVVDSKNTKDFIYNHLEIYYSGPPPHLKPGELVEGTVGLRCGRKLDNFSTSLILPIEKYRVYLEVNYDLDKRGTSNTIEFEIVEPRGKEKQAYGELLTADSLMRLKSFEEASKKLIELSRKYPTSVYAQSSLQLALVTLRYLYAGKEKFELLELSREFIEKYPNSNYISSPMLNLLEYYQSKKDKTGFMEELNTLIKKYPESEVSKWAQKRLETIDDLKF